MQPTATMTDKVRDQEASVAQEDLDQPIVRVSFSDLSQMTRAELLQGPTPLLITTHTGIDFDHEHQIAAAKHMVCADRVRQLHEQAESNNRAFAIEFPADALAAASPIFKQGYEAHGATLRQLPVDIGTVLPGYTMCVLDWYAHALRSKTWFDFIPEDASTEGDDKWYWVYCYSAMRSLTMHEFTDRLQGFIEGYMDSLMTDFHSYAHLLRSLPLSDPLIRNVAERTASETIANRSPLNDVDGKALEEHFPDFMYMVCGYVELLLDGKQPGHTSDV
jgi:hypothetical protein